MEDWNLLWASSRYRLMSAEEESGFELVLGLKPFLVEMQCQLCRDELSMIFSNSSLPKEEVEVFEVREV